MSPSTDHRRLTWRDRAANAAPWPVRVAADLLRGPDKRHRARARLRGEIAALTWRNRWRTRGGSRGGKPVVAVALLQHFGDIVAAEPIARQVRARHPDAHLIWITSRPYAPLLADHAAIDEVAHVGCITEWIHLKRHHPFDHLYDLHLHGRFCDRCVVPIDRRHDGDPSVHAGNYYQRGNLLSAFCRAALLPVLTEGPALTLPHRVKHAVDALGLAEPFVVIHARSNQAERDWAAPHWRELVRRLTERGVNVVEVGLSPVIGEGVAGYHDATGRLDLLETAEAIRRAAVFVGIDSGPAHLANAVGTRGVIVLGRYMGLDRYVPYSGDYATGQRATLLHADGPAATLPVEPVFDAVLDALRLQHTARRDRQETWW